MIWCRWWYPVCPPTNRPKSDQPTNDRPFTASTYGARCPIASLLVARAVRADGSPRLEDTRDTTIDTISFLTTTTEATNSLTQCRNGSHLMGPDPMTVTTRKTTDDQSTDLPTNDQPTTRPREQTRQGGRANKAPPEFDLVGQTGRYGTDVGAPGGKELGMNFSASIYTTSTRTMNHVKRPHGPLTDHRTTTDARAPTTTTLRTHDHTHMTSHTANTTPQPPQ
jgi:hypothetical protein